MNRLPSKSELISFQKRLKRQIRSWIFSILKKVPTDRRICTYLMLKAAVLWWSRLQDMWNLFLPILCNIVMMVKSRKRPGISSKITAKLSIIAMSAAFWWIIMLKMNGNYWKTMSCLQQKMQKPSSRWFKPCGIRIILIIIMLHQLEAAGGAVPEATAMQVVWLVRCRRSWNIGTILFKDMVRILTLTALTECSRQISVRLHTIGILCLFRLVRRLMMRRKLWLCLCITAVWVLTWISVLTVVEPIRKMWRRLCANISATVPQFIKSVHNILRLNGLPFWRANSMRPGRCIFLEPVIVEAVMQLCATATTAMIISISTLVGAAQATITTASMTWQAIIIMKLSWWISDR